MQKDLHHPMTTMCPWSEHLHCPCNHKQPPTHIHDVHNTGCSVRAAVSQPLFTCFICSAVNLCAAKWQCQNMIRLPRPWGGICPQL